MPTYKPTVPPNADDPAEYQRFLDMAREVEADESPGALDRALDKLDVVRPEKTVIAEPTHSGTRRGRGRSV
jgi:hypothetical protein